MTDGMKEIRKKVLDLAKQNLSLTDIARELETTTSTVSYHITKLKESGHVTAPLPRKMGKRAKKKMSPTRKKVLALLGQALSQADIARELGISRQAVSQHVQKIRTEEPR